MRANLLIPQTNVIAVVHPCLPYALVFDILHELDNLELNKKVYQVFSNRIPIAQNYSNSIDLWVDLEANGNMTILIANELALIISQYLNDQGISFKLVFYKNIKLTADNGYFLEYLCKFNDTIRIHYQDQQPSLKNFEKFLQWDCFINFKKMDYENDAGNICYALWRLAELGAEEVAFRLFEKAILQVHSSYMQNLYLVQMQFMRIATMHYQQAADETRQVHAEFSELQQSFYLTKAWGNTLLHRLKEAGHYFQLAHVHSDLLPENIDQLYKMNIFALYNHLSGKSAIALLIENKIKNCILNLKTKRPQITYINAINLARLYRDMQDFSEAKTHYDIAFENTTVDSESSPIYKQVCYSLLYEKQQMWSLAFEHWAQAWILWCKMKTPEALTWRAVRAIGLFDFQPHDLLDIQKVNDCFLQKLNTLATNMIGNT